MGDKKKVCHMHPDFYCPDRSHNATDGSTCDDRRRKHSKCVEGGAHASEVKLCHLESGKDCCSQQGSSDAWVCDDDEGFPTCAYGGLVNTPDLPAQLAEMREDLFKLQGKVERIGKKVIDVDWKAAHETQVDGLRERVDVFVIKYENHLEAYHFNKPHPAEEQRGAAFARGFLGEMHKDWSFGRLIDFVLVKFTGAHVVERDGDKDFHAAIKSIPPKKDTP